MKGGDPFGAVFSPEQDAIARTYALPGQQGGKPAGQPRQFPISGYAAAVSLIPNHGNLAVKTAKIVQQCSKVIEQGRSISLQSN
jgi:hypothetical protein